MQSFIRGQRAKISAFSSSTLFEVSVSVSSARVKVFDFVSFGIDAQGQLSDDRFMVFFNQKNAPDDAIVLLELGDQSARFSVDLDKVPLSVARLVFTASVDGAGAMRDLQSGAFALQEAGASLLEYRFQGADFKEEGALMLAEIYRKDGEWRVWAQGQGFAGDLSALLKHFGGLEIEESAAPPVQASPQPQVQPPTQQPAPPISLPATASVVAAPMPVVLAPAMGALQSTLDSAASGATVQLPRGEYRGPITINRPVTIEGAGAVIWALSGPVVRVQSDGVVLRGVAIEVTDAEPNQTEGDVALWVESGAPTLQNVSVRGRVVGVQNANASDWRLPTALDLGELAPNSANSLVFALETPVACRLKASVSGIQLLPAAIEAGKNEVQIVVAGVGPDTFLAGHIELENAGLVRTIALYGRVAGRNSTPVQNRRLNAVDITQSAP